MAGEIKRAQFIDSEVYPVIRKTVPSMLDRLVALEEAVAELCKPTTVSKAKMPKEPTLSDAVGGKEGVAAIKSSKTLVEAIAKIKKAKAKKSKK